MSRYAAWAYRAVLLRCARLVAQGLIHFGASIVGFDPREAVEELNAPALQGPPGGHPERVVDGALMSRDELQLWAQLF
jgi:hypothetical protein